MAKKQSIVEEAIIQMKSLENVIAENAKGILASTMKQEIGELVKESLKKTEEDESKEMDEEMDEQEMDDMDSEDDVDSDDDTEMDSDMDSEDDDTEMEFDMDSDMDSEDDDTEMEFDMDSEDDDTEMEFDMDAYDEPHVDLTNASDEEILKVFKEMGDNDGIIVKKEGDTIDLEDSENDAHYKISMSESEEWSEIDMSSNEDEDESDDLVFEIEMDEEMDEHYFYDENTSSGSGMKGSHNSSKRDYTPNKFGSFDDEEWFDETDRQFNNDFDFDFEDEEFEDLSSLNSKHPKNTWFGDDSNADRLFNQYKEKHGKPFKVRTRKSTDEIAEKMETKEGFKPKGIGMGKAKFSYEKTKGGFKEDMKQGKTVGTGKPKFEYKESKKMEMKKPAIKKGGETSEASRTLGAGKAFGRKGLSKPKAAPSHLKVENVQSEVKILRERNEEYRKALNVFRTKLNEVAVFNSNLAYATRLFTEHSTTKQEKINILRRFDGVESLKESKTLYKTIKDELSSDSKTKVVKESLQEKIEKTPASGSAVNLIESKTYENPQFMRMKDLMTKMNVIK
jgi:hypothetical protein